MNYKNQEKQQVSKTMCMFQWLNNIKIRNESKAYFVLENNPITKNKNTKLIRTLNLYSLIGLFFSRQISHSRMVIISTFLVCTLIIALGIVLGIKIYKNDNESSNPTCGESGSEGQLTGTQQKTTVGPKTTPKITLPTTSPETTRFISNSVEGHYRYGAVASDAGLCSTVGTWVQVYQ